jgi:hypothetical protein
MSAWIVKGKPSRNDLSEMLQPGLEKHWVTKKPPRTWAPGDLAFMWKGSPALCVLGTAEITRINKPDDEGFSIFFLRYTSWPFENPIGIQQLREDPAFADASFLKSGAAGTLFPLSEAQTLRLQFLIEEANGEQRANGELLPVSTSDLEESEEGRRMLNVHFRRERRPALRAAKIRQADGRLACEVCNFDFPAVYPGLGDGYVEVHHREPLGERPVQGSTTTLEELALVCANCHRMLHRREGITVDGLRNLLRVATSPSSGQPLQ